MVWVAHFVYIFFFKQKTAYELRISDWSSDVCSSDLAEAVGHALSRDFGFKIPQRAVDRVARGARGHDALDFLARRARLDRAARRLDRGECARGRFAIAWIGHTFAAAGEAVAPDFDRHHIRDGLDPARDAERPG